VQLQSPVMEDQVATPDMQEAPMRRLDYSTSGSNFPNQVGFLMLNPGTASLTPLTPSCSPP